MRGIALQRNASGVNQLLRRHAAYCGDNDDTLHRSAINVYSVNTSQSQLIQ